MHSFWNGKGQRKHAKEIAYLKHYEDQLLVCDKVLEVNCPNHNIVVLVYRGITTNTNFGFY